MGPMRLDVMDVGTCECKDLSENGETLNDKRETQTDTQNTVNIRAWSLVLLVSSVVLFSIFLGSL